MSWSSMDGHRRVQSREVEWAIATRVQGDRDIMIVSNARGTTLDPSLAPDAPGICRHRKGGDRRTISEGIPRSATRASPTLVPNPRRRMRYLGGKADHEAEKALRGLSEKLA